MNIHFRGFEPNGLVFIDDTQARALDGATVAGGDVLLNITGASIGRVAIAPAAMTDARVNQHVCIIRPTKELLPEFLAMHFSSPDVRRWVSEENYGVTRQALTKQMLVGYWLALPPLSEQRRIVARIEALFARTRRARADLERIAPLSDRNQLATLRAGVTGQLTEAWRRAQPVEDVRVALLRVPPPKQGRGGREATDKVIPGIAALSVNNPGTQTPPGWVWTPLLRVARQETGHTPSRRIAAYWEGGDVPWVGIRDAGAHHGGTIFDTMQKCTEMGLANSSARLLPAGTVCLSRTASVGYVTILGAPMATSQDFATWTCTPALLPEYLKFALLAEGDDIRRFGEGSTHTTIYFPEIRALHICLPSLEEQAEIVRLLTSSAIGMTVASAEATHALALLDRLERSILARAFRGELVPQDASDSNEAPPATSSTARRQTPRQPAVTEPA